MANPPGRSFTRRKHRRGAVWLLLGLGGALVAVGVSVPWFEEAPGWRTRSAASSDGADEAAPGPTGEPALAPERREQTDPGIPDRDWYTGGPVSGTQVAAATPERPALVFIRGGEFVMGSPPEEKHRNSAAETQHRVRVSSFVMCETEVTQSQFAAVRGALPDRCPGGCGDALPANGVSWFDAIEYLDALSTREGLRPCYAGRRGDEVTWDPTCDGYRLPTEAEWEYAARAGTTTAFSFGDVGSEAEDLKHIARYAWFWVGSFTKAKPVRTRLANPWNLFDMHGNVWEWVWDLYAKDYGVDLAALTIDPRGPPGASGERVARGGSFGLAESNLRSAQRIWFPPAYRIKNYGFRCARGAARARN